MVTASQRLQDTCKVLAGTDTLLTHPLRGDAQSRASILQALLRTRAGTDVRPTGRRCSSGRHVRSICLFSMPWGRRSGLGNPGSNPGGATSKPDLTMCEVGLRGSELVLAYYTTMWYATLWRTM